MPSELIAISLVGFSLIGQFEPDFDIQTDKLVTSPICGHACLKIVLGLFGQTTDIDDIVDAIPPGDTGASISQLEKYLHLNGIPATKFRGSPDLIRNEDSIYLLRIDKEGYDHYVLARPKPFDAYLVIDPYESPTLFRADELQSIFLGDGIEISLIGDSSSKLAASSIVTFLVMGLGIGFVIFGSIDRRISARRATAATDLETGSNES